MTIQLQTQQSNDLMQTRQLPAIKTKQMEVCFTTSIENNVNIFCGTILEIMVEYLSNTICSLELENNNMMQENRIYEDKITVIFNKKRREYLQKLDAYNKKCNDMAEIINKVINLKEHTGDFKKIHDDNIANYRKFKASFDFLSDYDIRKQSIEELSKPELSSYQINKEKIAGNKVLINDATRQRKTYQYKQQMSTRKGLTTHSDLFASVKENLEEFKQFITAEQKSTLLNIQNLICTQTDNLTKYFFDIQSAGSENDMTNKIQWLLSRTKYYGKKENDSVDIAKLYGQDLLKYNLYAITRAIDNYKKIEFPALVELADIIDAYYENSLILYTNCQHIADLKI